nr:hypothetical protein HmN_000968600 [Hymenolepis microstoma]
MDQSSHGSVGGSEDPAVERLLASEVADDDEDEDDVHDAIYNTVISLEVLSANLRDREVSNTCGTKDDLWVQVADAKDHTDVYYFQAVIVVDIHYFAGVVSEDDTDTIFKPQKLGGVVDDHNDDDEVEDHNTRA